MLLPGVATVLSQAVQSGACPVAQATVIVDGQCVHQSAHGAIHGGKRPTSLQTQFDVASLTKVITTVATGVLLSRRVLRLDTPIGHALPRFNDGLKADTTVRQLLAHSSGLPAWAPLFEEARHDPVGGKIYPSTAESTEDLSSAFATARSRVVQAATHTPLSHAPGLRVYSDIGFIILGEALAATASESLDRFCAGEIFQTLGLRQTGFRPLPGSRNERPAARIAPTGETRPREPAPGQEMLYGVHPQTRTSTPGEVDDDNAFAMAGVAGHAGVFSTANDIATLGWKLVEELHGARLLGDPTVFRQLVTVERSATGPERALGLDRPTGPTSSAGRYFGQKGPAGAVGHLGFTGTSLWVDLDRRLVVALLTNRVFPSRRNVDVIRALRPALHDTVVQSLGLE